MKCFTGTLKTGCIVAAAGSRSVAAVIRIICHTWRRGAASGRWCPDSQPHRKCSPGSCSRVSRGRRLGCRVPRAWPTGRSRRPSGPARICRDRTTCRRLAGLCPKRTRRPGPGTGSTRWSDRPCPGRPSCRASGPGRRRCPPSTPAGDYTRLSCTSGYWSGTSGTGRHRPQWDPSPGRYKARLAGRCSRAWSPSVTPPDSRGPPPPPTRSPPAWLRPTRTQTPSRHLRSRPWCSLAGWLSTPAPTSRSAWLPVRIQFKRNIHNNIIYTHMAMWEYRVDEVWGE